MILINIATATDRKTVTASVNDTPASILESNGIEIGRHSATLGGQTLSGTAMGRTFADLGVADGATVRLGAVVKQDGASE